MPGEKVLEGKFHSCVYDQNISLDVEVYIEIDEKVMVVNSKGNIESKNLVKKLVYSFGDGSEGYSDYDKLLDNLFEINRNKNRRVRVMYCGEFKGVGGLDFLD